MFEIDRALKIFADRYAADYVHWLLGPDVQPVEKLSGEIPALPRQADIVHRVEDARQRAFIFHLEFQTQRPREPMGRRVLGYNVRLREVYKLPVCSAVVYLLRGRMQGISGATNRLVPSRASDSSLNMKWRGYGRYEERNCCRPGCRGCTLWWG